MVKIIWLQHMLPFLSLVYLLFPWCKQEIALAIPPWDMVWEMKAAQVYRKAWQYSISPLAFRTAFCYTCYMGLNASSPTFCSK